MSTIVLAQQTTPAAPSVGFLRIYVDQADSVLKTIDSNGEIKAFDLISDSHIESVIAGLVNKAWLDIENVENTADLDKPISTATLAALALKQDALAFTPENVANKNQANGYAGLDATGKVPLEFLPASLMNLHGSWDASINTPHLEDHAVGVDVGDVYDCTVAGTVDFGHGPIAFQVGDWAIFGADGHWYLSPNSDMVRTVQGRMGNVVITKNDLGLENVPNVDATIAENITQDSTHKFVTDSQITNWDAKQPAGDYITELTGDVTASGAGSSVATLANSGVTAGSYVNANVTVNSKGLITEAITTQWAYLLSSAATSSSSTYAPIAGLTTASLPIGTYKFKVIGPFQSASVSVGIGLRLNQVTAVIGTVSAKWLCSQSANGTASNFQYDQLSTTTNVTSSAVQVANTNVLVAGEGVFSIKTAGTVAIELRSRTAGTVVTLQPNTYLIIEKII